MSTADDLLKEYDEVTETYQNLPESEQEGKNYEEYEDALLRIVHGMADELRPKRSATPVVTAEVASHVLWHLDPGHPAAREPGSFTSSLLDTWAKADGSNSRKLSAAFPEYGACVDVLKTPGGAEAIAILAKNGR